MPDETHFSLNSQEFSLVLGGPLFQLFRKSYLSGDYLQLLRRRVVVLSLLTWLPLWILSSLTGTQGGVPFLHDLEVHVRFLVAMPLLIVAELIVHQRMRGLVQAFLNRDLIGESDLPRFDAALSSAFRLRNSLAAEVLLVVLVYVVGMGVIWRNYIALNAATWYLTPSASGNQLTLAGLWYAYLSVPFFQFLLVRWYFRLFVWTRFLWHVSRIPLKLLPTHPDGVGGLGFLSLAVEAFAPLLVAHGALVAGQIANRIFFMGEKLPEFKGEIALVVVFLVCLLLCPLLLLVPQLHQLKLTGLAEYGTLAQRYVREFDDKWLRGGAPAEEPLVGSADIQSLADLGNSFQVVKSMRVVPFHRGSVMMLVVATLLPILPLTLTMMPLEDLLKKLLGILF